MIHSLHRAGNVIPPAFAKLMQKEGDTFMNSQTAQNLSWFIFLIGYTAYKYLAGLQSWNTGYAIQVAIIALLTAVIPYYATRFAISRQSFAVATSSLIFMPTVLAVIGYGIFYVVFVRPNFPEVTAAQVMPRGLTPGVCVSVILAAAFFWSRSQTDTGLEVGSS
jgi:hypothetical protein